jgi:hypothetical protein
MASARFAMPCLLLALGTPAHAAADLTTIDRAIRKEPAYRSKQPLYCLLVFGPEAKTRAWLVLDDEAVYLDRNGNGDLTEEGERLGEFRTHPRPEPRNPVAEYREFVQEIRGKDGVLHPPLLRSTAARHWGLIVSRSVPKEGYVAETPEEQEAVSRVRRGFVRVSLGSIREDRRIVQSGKAVFSHSPQDAPILWFDGPQTLELAEDALRRDMVVRVVSPGLGEGSITVLQEDSVPEDLHPVATILYPGKAPDGEPVTTAVPLDQRC